VTARCRTCSFGSNAYTARKPTDTNCLRNGLIPADPFTLGVAAGDPAPNGAVILTRLAPNPSGVGVPMR
jgi:phosphodiesterase/alkaline phosphatase D-like protein